MKVPQFIDAGNLRVSSSSIDRTFFSLFPEFEDLVGNLVVKVLQEVNQHKLTIQLRLLKIINDGAHKYIVTGVQKNSGPKAVRFQAEGVDRESKAHDHNEKTEKRAMNKNSG